MARELAVDYVVEGAIRRAGDQVALTIQLIRARSETNLFARRYQARLTDVFGMQRAAAQDIAAQLDEARLLYDLEPETPWPHFVMGAAYRAQDRSADAIAAHQKTD